MKYKSMPLKNLQLPFSFICLIAYFFLIPPVWAQSLLPLASSNSADLSYSGPSYFSPSHSEPSQTHPSHSLVLTEKTFTTSDGVHLQYLEGGQGPQTIVFIPGWLMPADIFSQQLSYFAKNYHVVSLSPRSQGKSDIYLGDQLAQKRVQDIQELLQTLKTHDFILVGWSLGVMEALDYVNRYGKEGLKGLILIDNSIGEGSGVASTKRVTRSKMTTEKFQQFAKGFARSIFKLPPTTELLNSVESSALRLSKFPQAAFQILEKPYPREYYRKTIYASQLPVWYAITPRYKEQAILFSEKYPLGSYTIYEREAGHALFVDQANLFNQDMANFLRTLN